MRLELIHTLKRIAPYSSRGLLIVMALLIFPSMTAAQTWEPVGPSGGTFYGSVSDPADVDTITVFTSSPAPSFVYRTHDGGATWMKIGEVPYSYINDLCAYDFSRIFAMSSNYCYYTTDGGTSWSSGQFPYSFGYASTICVDPTDPSKVYAAGSRYDSGTASYQMAFFSSPDGGATWAGSNFFSFDSFHAYDMAISKTNPDVVYIGGYKSISGTYYMAVFKSDDAGATWTDISSLVETTSYRYAYTMAIDPLNENRVYVAGSYFYYSIDGGASWTKNSSYYYSAHDIGIDPVNTNNLYMASYSNVYTSTDHGATWTRLLDVINGLYAYVEVAPAAPSTVHIATTYGGFYRSTDSGATWNSAHEGIYAHGIASMAVSPSQPNALYIDLYASSELVHSNDCGNHWQSVIYPSGCSSSVGAVNVNAMNPGIVMALEASG